MQIISQRPRAHRLIPQAFFIYLAIFFCLSCAAETNLESSQNKAISNTAQNHLPQKADSLINETNDFWVRLLKKRHSRINSTRG